MLPSHKPLCSSPLCLQGHSPPARDTHPRTASCPSGPSGCPCPPRLWEERPRRPGSSAIADPRRGRHHTLAVLTGKSEPWQSPRWQPASSGSLSAIKAERAPLPLAPLGVILLLDKINREVLRGLGQVPAPGSSRWKTPRSPGGRHGESASSLNSSPPPAPRGAHLNPLGLEKSTRASPPPTLGQRKKPKGILEAFCSPMEKSAGAEPGQTRCQQVLRAGFGLSWLSQDDPGSAGIQVSEGWAFPSLAPSRKRQHSQLKLGRLWRSDKPPEMCHCHL